MSGVISSVITNSAAMVASQSLNSINASLQTVQNAVSTGYSVSSAVDNGAAFAVAQTVRTQVQGLTAANQQLGDTQGLLSTTNTALQSISTLMTSMKQTLVNLSSNGISSSQRSQYAAQYTSQLANLKSYIKGATYNGKTVIDGYASSGYGSITMISDGSGSTFTIGSSNVSQSVYNAITALAGKGFASVASALTATGAFSNAVSSLGSFMNTYGNFTNQIDNQITFNQNKINALNNGLGALVDANMTQESAKLNSLQIQQQLATQALSIADQAPSILVKLF